MERDPPLIRFSRILSKMGKIEAPFSQGFVKDLTRILNAIQLKKAIQQIRMRGEARCPFVILRQLLTAVEKCGARRVRRGGPKVRRAEQYFV